MCMKFSRGSLLLVIWLCVFAASNAHADFLYTKQAGEKWLISPAPQDFSSVSVHPLITSMLAGVRHDRTVWYSTDFGKKWVQWPAQKGLDFHQIVFGTKATFVLAKDSSVWIKEGSQPKFVRQSTGTAFWQLSIDSDNRLWGVTSTGIIKYSSNQGKSWTVATRSTGSFITYWKMLAHGNNGMIFALRFDGTVHRSADRGKSWKSMNVTRMKHIATGHDGELWAVNGSGEIWSNAYPNRSTRWSKESTGGLPFGATSVQPLVGPAAASGTLVSLASLSPPLPRLPPDTVTGRGCSAFKPCPDNYSCQPGVHKCYPKARLEGQPCSLGFECANGLSCEAGAQVCRAPGKLGDACHATRPCGSGFSCQPGVHKCFNVPRKEGQACSLGYGCANGLTCEAGSQVCRKPGEVSEACHATRPCKTGLSCQPGVHKCYHSPRLIMEPCSAGFECGEGLSCAAGTQRCVLGDSWGDPEACKKVWHRPTAEKTKGQAIGAMTYGTGSAQTAGIVSLSEEVGVVYGNEGQFGCYASTCGGAVSDLSISLYGAIGEFTSYDAVAGQSEVYGAGGSFPLLELGGSISLVKAMGGTEVLGSVQSIGVGFGVLPAQVSALKCTTEVTEVFGKGGKPVKR